MQQANILISRTDEREQMTKLKETAGYRWKKVLIYLMEKHGLTQQEIADTCQITQSRISKMADNLKDNFQDRTIVKVKPILEKYGINPDYLQGLSRHMLSSEADAMTDASPEELRQQILELKEDYLKERSRALELERRILDLDPDLYRRLKSLE